MDDGRIGYSGLVHAGAHVPHSAQATLWTSGHSGSPVRRVRSRLHTRSNAFVLSATIAPAPAPVPRHLAGIPAGRSARAAGHAVPVVGCSREMEGSGMPPPLPAARPRSLVPRAVPAPPPPPSLPL